MHKQIFVNLAVADTAKSKAFISAPGYSCEGTPYTLIRRVAGQRVLAHVPTAPGRRSK